MPHESILLVEDDPADVRLIQRAFNKLNSDVTVHRLSNGDDAIAYLAGDSPYDNRAAYPMPSVVLLDIKLPRRSGFEVLEWVRRQASAVRRLPVVMLTSSKFPADINRAYDLGVNSFILKPVTFDSLVEITRTLSKYWFEVVELPSEATEAA